jgi:hypothetical protein
MLRRGFQNATAQDMAEHLVAGLLERRGDVLLTRLFAL